MAKIEPIGKIGSRTRRSSGERSIELEPTA
jgi:hypothetical protein